MRLVALLVVAWVAWLLTLPPRPAEWLVIVSGLLVLVVASRAAFRGHAGPWRAYVAGTWDLHALAGILLVALAVQFADAHGITTDGVIYFSQLRSVIFDRDLDVAAEFAALGQPPRPSHVVPIGPTFVWLPLYLAVAAFDAVSRALGIAANVSERTLPGMTLPFVRAALVSSFAIGAVGLFVVHYRLRREFSSAVAFAATTMLFGATPLVWYMVYEPSMTHAASFGFVAMFIVAAARWTGLAITRAQSLALGVLLGLAVMTRPQEALFALFPATLLLCAPGSWHGRLRAAMRLAGWAFVGVAPFLVLQAAHSAILLNRESFALVGASGGYLDFRNSHWADTLWSSWHGFFAWTPVAYLAFVAMFAYAFRNRGWAIAAVAIVLLMAWVNGSTADWSAGWSFGGRRFISVLAVLAPGLALIVQVLTRKPVVAVAMISVLAIVWNQLLVVQHTRGMLGSDAPVSFAQIIRQQAQLVTGSAFFYPFAFPANVIFARRSGLPIDQYDLLGAEELRDTFALEMNDGAARYLTAGWGNRLTDPFGELRWIEGERAELLLPLDVPPGREVAVTWSARTRRLDPPAPATFALVINGRETYRFTPDTEQATFFTFTVPANEPLLVRGFNRIAFERRAGAAPVAIYMIAIK